MWWFQFCVWADRRDGGWSTRSTYVGGETERIWMGRLIVMIMTGPVGVIVHSIIIVVGNSLKRELNFSLLDLENIKTKKDWYFTLCEFDARAIANDKLIFISVLQNSKLLAEQKWNMLTKVNSTTFRSRMSRQDLVVLVMLVAIPALPATPCVEVCKDQETFSHLVESCRCGGRIVNTAGQSRNPVQPGYHRPQRPQQPVRVSYPASSYRWVVDLRSQRGQTEVHNLHFQQLSVLPLSSPAVSASNSFLQLLLFTLPDLADLADSVQPQCQRVQQM